MSYIYRTRTAAAWLILIAVVCFAQLAQATTTRPSANTNCPSIAFSFTVTGTAPVVSSNQTPVSATVTIRSGGSMAVGPMQASVPIHNLRFVEKLTSNGNIIVAGTYQVETDRAPTETSAANFNGTQGPYTLINPQLTGVISQTHTPYIDSNNNNQFDPATECLGTPAVLVYNILPACPNITFSYAMTGCTNSIVLSNTTSSGSATIALCSGGTMAVGPVSTSVSVSTLRLLNKVTSNGNVIFQGRALETNRSIIDVPASDYFNRSYGPYDLVNPQVTGTISETFTPYIDQNGDGRYNEGTECLGQPLTLFYTIALPIPQAPTNGLVAHYPFNGNANDESGNGRNGTANGATLTTDRFGVANKAYDFDGNDWIQVAPSPTLQGNDFTLTAWIKPMPNNNQFNIIVGQTANETTQNAWYLGLYEAGTQVLGYTYQDNYVQTNITASNANWRQVVYSKTGTTARLFIDGVVQNSHQVPANISFINPRGLLIGADDDAGNDGIGDTWFFYGKIDDVRIYSRGLSDSEITQLYQSEAPPATPPAPANSLIAYYPFNGNANDASGNNNNGIVQGATLVPDRRGTPNGAYRFADGNKIVVANSTSLTLNNAYSFSGWFNLRSFTGRNGNDGSMSNTAGVHTIFSKNCDRDWLFFMVLPSPDGVPRMNFAGGTWQSGLSAFKNLNLDTWIHVAHVHSNNQSQLYINGVMAAASVGRIDFAASNQQNLIIGGMNCWPYFFNGELDDIRFYNRALTTQEIKDIFIAENGPIQSIKTGSWLDPTTWSCNCIPTTNNPVEVKHVVNVPAAQTGYGYSLKYGVGGRVDMGSGAKVVLVEE
ncbi:MAG: LamG domain-containing protein [Cytophagales bacterium]|nr:MAG: LamG domain-containing protein [Cytophagales bacterium]